MTKAQLISMWCCVAYFVFVLFSSAGRFLWGNLGVLRPSDPGAENNVVDRDYVVELLNGWADDFNRTWILLSIGIVGLFCLMLWVTFTRKQSPNHRLQLTGDARD